MKKIFLLQSSVSTIGAYTTRKAAELAYRYHVEIIGWRSSELSIRSICLECKSFVELCMLDEDRIKLGL